MNERLQAMLAKKVLGDGKESGKGSTSPIVATLLNTLGVSPELLTGLVAQLQHTAKTLEDAAINIETRLTSIENRLTQIEHNMQLSSSAEDEVAVLVTNFVDLSLDPEKAN